MYCRCQKPKQICLRCYLDNYKPKTYKELTNLNYDN